MKRVLVAGIAAAFCGAPAFAADMAVKAQPPPPAPVQSWTGCYVGGNIGYGQQRTSTTDVDSFNVYGPYDMGSDTGSGAVGGGQVGCDYQFAGNWVVGIEGMFDGADVKGSHTDPFSYSGDTTEYHSAKADWFGTLTARFGYAVTPGTLLYVKGGGAWVHDTFADADPSGTFYPPYSGQATTTRTGWTIGGGGEYKFSVNWSVFAEYNYIGLGSRTSGYTYNCGAGCYFPNPYLFSDKNNFQTVLVGLNYRFGGPVVAKY